MYSVNIGNQSGGTGEPDPLESGGLLISHRGPLPNLNQPPIPSMTSASIWSQYAPPVTSSGRQPRSRKNRPCDLCRRTKSRCTIGPLGPPCSHCTETRRQCTFDFAPPPRKVRARQDREDLCGTGSAAGGGAETSNPPRREVYETDTRRSHASSGDRSSPPFDETHSIPLVRADGDAPRVPFDRLADAGFNPYVLTVVLTDDLLPIHNEYEAGEMRADGPFVKQISRDPGRPTFVIMEPKSDASQTNGPAVLARIRAFLRANPLRPSDGSLLARYHARVHPALPILEHNSTLSPQLLSAIICTSLSHSAETRPLAAPSVALYANDRMGEHDSSLDGVAAALLELGLRPDLGNRGSYMLLARTIALAQLLGMHMDPRKWNIPVWEQELRIRLWWMLRIHDAWMSFLNSRPCHIQAYNSNVPIPSLTSVVTASSAYGNASSDSAKAFVASCRLSQLVCRLQVEVCTLGVVGENDPGARAEEVVAIGSSADGLYTEWSDLVQQEGDRATGVNSFLVHLLCFRCMLKRIHIELEHGLGSTFTPTAEILAPFRDCVDFLSRLSEPELDGYYLLYASHVLSSVTSSLIRMSLASEYTPDSGVLELMRTLIDRLRHFHTTCSWDVAVPALGRATAVAERFSGIDEHPEVCSALLGSNVLPPVEGSRAEDRSSTEIPSVNYAGEQMLWDFSASYWDFMDLSA